MSPLRVSGMGKAALLGFAFQGRLELAADLFLAFGQLPLRLGKVLGPVLRRRDQPKPGQHGGKNHQQTWSGTPPDGWDGRLRRPIQGSRKALPERRKRDDGANREPLSTAVDVFQSKKAASEFPLGDLTISRRRPHGQRAEVGRHGNSRNRCQPIFLAVRVLRRGSLVCITPHPKQARRSF